MKKSVMTIISLLCVLCTCISINAQAVEVQSEKILNETLGFYQDGDVVGFIGDSITHAKYCSVNYVDALYQYYLTHFPDRQIEFRNLSTAGFKASDILDIYDLDPSFVGINKAVIMLGTNEAILKTSTSKYIKNMETLINCLKEDGLKGEDILILTSPICDENYASSSQWKFENRLIEYISELELKSDEWGVQFLNIHTPMAELNESIRKSDSSFTLTTGDGIHPDTTGQLWIAYKILQAQGAETGNENVIVVPYKADNQISNREFSDLYCGEIGLYWTQEINMLPSALTEEQLEFYNIYEPGASFNQVVLKVKSLVKDANYQLFMGETMLGVFTGMQLEQGIDLALLEMFPLQMEARQLDERIREWHKSNVQYRNIWIDVMMKQVTYTEEQILRKFEQWRSKDIAIREAMREEISNMVQLAGRDYRMAIVEEGYSVEDLFVEEQSKIKAEAIARKEALEQAEKEAEEKARIEAEKLEKEKTEELERRKEAEAAYQAATKAAKREKILTIISCSICIVVIISIILIRLKR